MPRVSESAKAPARPARRISALRTDTAVIDAGTALLASVGIDGTTPAALSREAELSITAIRQRYTSVESFLRTIWSTRCLPLVVEPIFELVGEYLESDRSSNDGPPASLNNVLKQSQISQATLEILAASAHLPELLQSVQSDLKDKFIASSSSNTIKAAQQVTMLAVLIGLLARGRYSKAKTKETLELADQVLRALVVTGPVLPMPPTDSSHLDIYPFDTGDVSVNRILDSCLRNTGLYGFGAITTKQIAAGAGVSEGLLFSKFPTKVSALIEATSLQTRMGFADNLTFSERLLTEFGQSMANAIFIREWCRPGIELQRSVYLEQLRLSWHVPEVRKAQEIALKDLLADLPQQHRAAHSKQSSSSAAAQLQVAIPTGVVFIAVLLPDAYTLPYSAVTPGLF